MHKSESLKFKLRAFSTMRRGRRRGGAAAGALPPKCDNDPLLSPSHVFFEGESLTRFLESFRRSIESAIAAKINLPYKFWIKQQFAVGVNEVTRVLERMPPNCEAETSSSKEQLNENVNDVKLPYTSLQAILIASDCNPRWLTKHLPALAASRNVPIITVKDKKEGSLRLGELIKLRTAIAIGIKAQGNSINQLMEEVLSTNKINNA